MIVTVVRKGFKSYGRYYFPGEVVEDLSQVKLLKCKLRERKISQLDTEDPDYQAKLNNLTVRLGPVVKARVELYINDNKVQPEPAAAPKPAVKQVPAKKPFGEIR